MTNKEAKKMIAGAVYDGIVWAAFLIGLSLLIASFVRNKFSEFDDTDFNGNRSGMEVLTDCRTGLQYLSTREGGLTPRLDQNANQIKEDCK